jgi:CheY-like chemotaxis protein
MSQAPTRGKTILVAEDHDEMRDVMRVFLENEGYRVLGAENGERAVEIALRERPDLIMMDLNMPVLDGFEAARRIRNHAPLSDVPIIANSAYGEHGIRFSLRDNELGPGFTFYLTKPFEFAELKEILERLLPHQDPGR